MPRRNRTNPDRGLRGNYQALTELSKELAAAIRYALYTPENLALMHTEYVSQGAPSKDRWGGMLFDRFGVRLSPVSLSGMLNRGTREHYAAHPPPYAAAPRSAPAPTSASPSLVDLAAVLGELALVRAAQVRTDRAIERIHDVIDGRALDAGSMANINNALAVIQREMAAINSRHSARPAPTPSEN